MKNKDLPKYNKRRDITFEDLKQLVDFVIKTPSNKEKQIDYYITHNNGQFYCKTKNLVTDLEGFKNIYKQGLILDTDNIYYNERLLDTESRKELINKLWHTE